MFRVGFITDKGIPAAENFNTRDEAETFILQLMDKEKLRQARIKDLTTGEEERVV